MRIQKPKEKLYYSLRQVSDMVGIEASLIKNWEKTFSQLAPMRNRTGNRYYSNKDLTLTFLIKELFYEKKLAIEEIQQLLKKELALLIKNESVQLKQALAEVKLELQEIKDLLEK